MNKRIITAAAVCAVLIMAACGTGGKGGASGQGVSGGTSSTGGQSGTSGQGASGAGGIVPLDQAIRDAAKNIEDNVPAGQIIAVLNFTSPSERFSEYVLEELTDRLVNGRKIVVVDRKELDLIRKEENFQLSGEVSDASMQSIGKKLGAQLIVSGSINVVGNAFRFRVRALAVETAAIATSYTADVNPAEARIASLFGGAKPAAAQTTAPSPGFVRVEGGVFQMGSNDGNDDGKPVHTVKISGFYMGKYEVTQKEWTAVMGNNPSRFKGDNLPAEQVSWYDAIEYCNRLSEKEKLTPVYTIDKSRKDGNNNNEDDNIKWTVRWNRNANGYRLPTEAEWEYAARGGNGSPGNYAFSGSNNVDEVAWHHRNSAGSTQEAGAKKPNGLGLYDMSGNVWEWCWDWYDENYYRDSPQSDPIGASWGSRRVQRGGSWVRSAQFGLFSTFRSGSTPSFRNVNNPDDYRDYAQGFRLARNAP